MLFWGICTALKCNLKWLVFFLIIYLKEKNRGEIQNTWNMVNGSSNVHWHERTSDICFCTSSTSILPSFITFISFQNNFWLQKFNIKSKEACWGSWAAPIPLPRAFIFLSFFMLALMLAVYVVNWLNTQYWMQIESVMRI